MKRPARPAAQLDLHLSVEASVDLTHQIQAAQWRIEELEAECLAHQQALAKLDARLTKLKKLQAYWERRAKEAEAARDALYQTRLGDADHPLHTECRRLTKEVDGLRQTLRQWAERCIAERRGAGGTGAPTHEDLTRLLVLAHPDQWSQGQPATELAHELAVAINKMREGARA
jgi:DNA repair ATPase RecN